MFHKAEHTALHDAQIKGYAARPGGLHQELLPFARCAFRLARAHAVGLALRCATERSG